MDNIGSATIKELRPLLQSWYGLSDPMTEELIHDRLGLHKNSRHAYLIVAAYNLKRIPNLMNRSTT